MDAGPLPTAYPSNLHDTADLNFSVPPLPQDSGLSEDLGGHHLSESSTTDLLLAGNSQRNTDGADDATPDTSVTDRGASHKSRKRRAVGK